MDDIAKPTMQLSQIQLRNFRCFKQLNLTFDAPYVLLTGANGIGKTSILEALYYTCYLRSFRTHSPRELITFGTDEFFIKIQLSAEQFAVSHAIQVGFSHNKRLVKIDQKPIVSYKELMSCYRIVSITENDLDLIQAGPHSRRLFMDQTLLFLDDAYASLLKTYRRIVDQRNALLVHRPVHQASYDILTRQLWQLAVNIEQRRTALLHELMAAVNVWGAAFIQQFCPMQFSYYSRRVLTASFDEFYQENLKFFEQEQRLGRTLFGPHLDDIHITFQGQSSRSFASRGQQKLIVLLIKMAQLEILAKKGIPGICLLDDFMTDFDEQHAHAILKALTKLGAQLIFTNPLQQSPLADYLQVLGAHEHKLAI